ncbi:MAG: DUF1289 domain-containing protein [Methyloprofundus sp.]|nr:DUF1289 domain-containing protein [Methyloprofundus sp.]
MQLENKTLYYIYDPMCSWCYAYEESITQLQEQLPSELKFKAILGGLAEDCTTPMPADTQAMIQQAWRQIQTTVPSIQFNFDFWTKNTPYRSTYPACRAILAAKNQSSDFSVPMRKAIQETYYQQAKNPSLDSILIECAAQIDLDMTQFKQDFFSPETNEKLTEQRHFARRLGVRSYPSLSLAVNHEPYALPIDYNTIDITLEQIHTLLATQSIDSPCVRNCCLNTDDMCLGCFRSLDEITHWAFTNNTEKQSILEHAKQRKIEHNKTLI